MQTATQPTIPPHLQMGLNSSEVIVQKPEDKALRAVVFVGDLMTSLQKRSPGYGLGGKILPDVKTLQYGILSRCAITPLRQGMMSVHKDLVEKERWSDYVSSYTATNVWNPVKGEFEDIQVGNGYLLYKAIPPARELGQIAVGGVVPVPHLETASDIKEAQLFYFPNWFDLLSGKDKLPATVTDLEDMLGNRMAKTQSEAMKAIGASYLQSCDNFRLFGKAYIDEQTRVIKEAEKPGVFATYDEIAERLFVMLEITRQDSLVKDFARQQNVQQENTTQITKAINLLAENASRPGMSATEIAQIVAATVAAMQANPASLAPLPPAPTSGAELEQNLTAGNVANEQTAPTTDEPPSIPETGKKTKAPARQ